MNVLDKLKTISKIGTQISNTAEENAKITISNIIILTAILTTLPFSVIYLSLQKPLLGIGILILCCMYSSIFLFNKKNKYTIAKFFTIIFPVIGILSYFLCLGPESGVHLILFPASILSFILFHPKQKKIIRLCFIFPILTFISLSTFGDHLNTVLVFKPIFLHIQNILSILISFSFTVFIIKLYTSQQLKLFNLEQEKQDIIKCELSTAINKLEDQNKTLEDYSNKKAYMEITKGIAHEIRSPMTILISGAQLLKNNIYQDQKSAEKFADIMITTMFKLEKLTSIMLKQHSNTTQNASTFKIKNVLEELIILTDIQCKKQKIKLESTLNSDQKLYGNRDFISQSLLNIIVNAIQHTNKKGKINILLSDYNNDHVKIIIKDSGTGIAKDQLETIFNKYQTTGENPHNQGLGLAFVHKVIADHKASITVKSEEEKGSEFIITWPIYTENKKSIPQISKTAF